MTNQIKKHDIDPQETHEWIDSIRAILETEGVERTHFIIEKMTPGEISRSGHFTDNQNKRAYRIIRLNKEIDAHKATLDEDYEKIKSTALLQKKENHIFLTVSYL